MIIIIINWTNNIIELNRIVLHGSNGQSGPKPGEDHRIRVQSGRGQGGNGRLSRDGQNHGHASRGDQREHHSVFDCTNELKTSQVSG